MIEKIRKTREYLDYLEEHYNNVQKAWEIIQEKCDGFSFNFLWDDYLFFNLYSMVKHHDESKLSQAEFVAYREYFYPIDDDEKKKADISEAWEHHKAHNKHHWESWTQAKPYYPNEQIVHLVHNIIDWMAMGMKFGDTARDYYEKNKDKIDMPEWAVELMYEIFDKVYPTEAPHRRPVRGVVARI